MAGIIQEGNDLYKIIQALNTGKSVCIPTDTLYAISCRADVDEYVSNIFSAKQRDLNKTLPILVGSLEMAMEYAEFDDFALQYAKAVWPGAVTIVLPASKDSKFLSKYCLKDGWVALRMPNREFLLEVINGLGVPLVGTSANLSGDENADSTQDLISVFEQNVQYIVQAAYAMSLKPSKIVKIFEKNITILR